MSCHWLPNLHRRSLDQSDTNTPRLSLWTITHVQDNFATVNEVGSAEHVVKNYYENPVYTHMAAIPSFFRWIPRPLGAPVLRFFMAKGLAAQNTTKIERVQCELKKLSDVLKDEDVGPTIDLLKVTWQSPLFVNCTVRTCSLIN